jgi:hypothetical protein
VLFPFKERIMIVKRRSLLYPSRAVLLAVGAVLLLAAGALRAQTRAAAEPVEVRIRDLPKLGRAGLVRTPEYQSNVRRTVGGSRRREWALLEVGYETAPAWIDELSFTFHVMTQDAQKQFHYFAASVVYADIERGSHAACVVLPPAAVARFGEPGAFGVEIFTGGERVAVKSAGPFGEEWWKLIGDKPNITRQAGYLVDRAKTPFAWAYIDDYEVVR